MAVTLVTTIQRFQGLSTDDKPESVPEGSTFHALDTGEEFIYHNEMWEIDLRLTKAIESVL